MNRKTKSKIRAAICCVFAFIVSFLLFCATLLIVAGSTVLNQDYARQSMKESQYYARLTSEIQAQLESYSDATGIPKSFFEANVEQIHVRNAVAVELDKLYGVEESSVSISEKQIQADFYEKLIAYAKEQGIEITSETEKSLLYFSQTCAQDYYDAITIPLSSTLAQLIARLDGTDGLVFKIFLLLLVVMAVLICYFFLVNKWKHRAMRYLLYSISGGFLMVLLVPLVVMFSGKITQVAIVNQSAYYLSVTYLTGIFQVMLVIAMILAAVTVALALVYHYMRKRISE